jgi:hypothetical protein
MAVRLAILVLLGVGVAVAVTLYRARSDHDAGLRSRDAAGDEWPPVPGELLAAAARTWLVFTTPMCASCPQVQADLESTFPGDAVVKVDATEHPELAQRYAVRRAPTTLLASADGSVLDRLVGPEAVRSFILAVR